MAKRPVSFTLPTASLVEARSLRKRHGFKTLSDFFRVVLSELDEKKIVKDSVDKKQISFRLDNETFDRISKLSKRLKVSVAEVVRLHVAQASGISDQRFAEILKTRSKKAKKKSLKRKAK